MLAHGTIHDGRIVKSGNLNLYNFPLLEKIQQKKDTVVKIRNDGKCAAMAEKTYGMLKEFSNSIFLNIGTGIGGAVFLNGKMLETKNYTGFEIGHMTIERNGRLCSCGKTGCFETYASMKVLKENIRNAYGLGKEVHSKELMEYLKNRTEKSESILNEYLENLKVGIANLIDLFEPEAICIGGSFAYYKDIFINPLNNKLKKPHTTFNDRKDIKIDVAIMKNDAGILGSVLKF